MLPEAVPELVIVKDCVPLAPTFKLPKFKEAGLTVIWALPTAGVLPPKKTPLITAFPPAFIVALMCTWPVTFHTR
jgi:hypothetical protein